MSAFPAALLKAQRHLARRDAVVRRLIKSVGACTLRKSRDRFGAPVRAIISQQISTKAAAAITARVEQTLASAGVTPAGILISTDEMLRQAGLSAGKVRSLWDLAEKVQAGIVPLRTIHRLPDEKVIEHLLPVRGIGRWTAEMFLIFSLGRLDVLPVDDWGFRTAVQRQYGLKEPPAKNQLSDIAEPWRPYRSIATWYFWRSLGIVPRSDDK